MGLGPVFAIPKALKMAGLKLADIDVIELNEAFAAQSLAVIKEAGLDPEKVNPNGGAIALGHPLGCTGAKLTATVIRELKRRNARYGMVTMCVGGGMGAAGIFENLNLEQRRYNSFRQEASYDSRPPFRRRAAVVFSVGLCSGSAISDFLDRPDPGQHYLHLPERITSGGSPSLPTETNSSATSRPIHGAIIRRQPTSILERSSRWRAP